MRSISLIIVHCSGVMPAQQSSARQIDGWHRSLGWKGIGYHYVVRRNGTVERGRPEAVVGSHCAGHNAHSIGVCYEGGLDISGMACDTRMPEQKESLRRLLTELRGRYPGAIILGHNHLNRLKACPCFDAAREYQGL